MGFKPAMPRVFFCYLPKANKCTGNVDIYINVTVPDRVNHTSTVDIGWRCRSTEAQNVTAFTTCERRTFIHKRLMFTIYLRDTSSLNSRISQVGEILYYKINKKNLYCRFIAGPICWRVSSRLT